MELTKVENGNLGGGIIAERADQCLEEAYDDILNPNKPAEAVREVHLIIKLVP